MTLDALARIEGMDAKLLTKPTPFNEAELQTLREFYAKWEALHKVPKDKLHRQQAEQAAQELVTQAHILRRMYG
jgi:flagellar hook-associated protein FlgK